MSELQQAWSGVGEAMMQASLEFEAELVRLRIATWEAAIVAIDLRIAALQAEGAAANLAEGFLGTHRQS
jgi:hypothetical protein